MSIEDQFKVSILLPTYNSEKYIKQTLDSIVKQVYKNYELVIIDNCSTDKTIEIINNYNNKINIKVFIKKTKNLAEALNMGLDNSHGDFIARIDSDDLIRKKRLLKQVEFLKNNSDYNLVGTNAIRFKKIKFFFKPFLIDYENIFLKISMIFHSPFIHPTMMFRKKFIIENKIRYDTNYNECEDYKLWYDISNLTKFKNLKYYGIFYRVHPLSASFKKKEKLNIYFKKINKFILENYNLNLTENEHNLLNKISSLSIEKQDNFDDMNINYIKILNKIKSNLKNKYNEKDVTKYLNSKYLRFCKRSIKSKNFKPIKTFNNSFKFNFINHIFINLLFVFRIKI